MYYIVTDSSTDMPQSWVEAQHDFHIVSLSCTINGVSSVPGTSEVAKKPANKKSSPKWDLLQGNLAEGGGKEVQHK